MVVAGMVEVGTVEAGIAVDGMVAGGTVVVGVEVGTALAWPSPLERDITVVMAVVADGFQVIGDMDVGFQVTKLVGNR